MNKKLLFLSLFVVVFGIALTFSYANAACDWNENSPDSCSYSTEATITSVSLSPSVMTSDSTSTLKVTTYGNRGYDVECSIQPYGCFRTYNHELIKVHIENNSNHHDGDIHPDVSLSGISNDEDIHGINIRSVDLSSNYWTNGNYTVTVYTGDITSPTSVMRTNFIINRDSTDNNNDGEPSVSLSTSDLDVFVGEPFTISWNSTSTSQCGAIMGTQYGFSTGGQLNGTDSVTITSTTTNPYNFTISCTGVGSNSNLTAQASTPVYSREHTHFGTDLVPYINIAPNSIARNSGELTIEWGNTKGNAILEDTTCTMSTAGFKNNVSFTENSGRIYIDSNYAGASNDNPTGTVTANLRCVIDDPNDSDNPDDPNYENNVSNISDTAIIKHNYVHWKAKLKNSCDDGDDSATDIPISYEHNNIRFDSAVVYSNVPMFYTDSVPDDGDDRSWGGLPKVYALSTSFFEGADPRDISDQYDYCSSSPFVTIDDVSGNQKKTIYMYFATPPEDPAITSPQNFDVKGECRQTVDNSGGENIRTQMYLSWSSVNGADSYGVYRGNGDIVGTTTDTKYIYRDFSSQPAYDKGRTFYVTAIDSNGNESDPSDSGSGYTPSSCSVEYPSFSMVDSLDIIPSSATILVNSCPDAEDIQFNALYDPDGPDDRYGHFDVNTSSTWTSYPDNMSTSDGEGLFSGVVQGSGYVQAEFNSKYATSNLDVNSCDAPSNIILNALGECHQNSPEANVEVKTQIYLNWSLVTSADHYDIYRDGSKISTTYNANYNDIFSSTIYGVSHSYVIKAIASSGDIISESNSAFATTPSNCNIPPFPSSNPTLNIIPTSASINEQSCSGTSKQFHSLYDPDGTGVRYGEFTVTEDSNWTSNDNSVAVSDNYLKGKFNSVNPGTTNVNAQYNIYQSDFTYSYIYGTAILNVTSCTSPDFNLSVYPITRDADVSDNNVSVTYTITVTPLNNFGGYVNLYISNLLNPMTETTSIDSFYFDSNGAKTSILTVNVPVETSPGQSAFYVEAMEYFPYSVPIIPISHSVGANINVINTNVPSVTATILPPTQSADGGYATLDWATTNATNCSIDNYNDIYNGLLDANQYGPGIVLDESNLTDSSGKLYLRTSAELKNYTFICSNSLSNVSDVATVIDFGNDGGGYPTATLSANPKFIDLSATSTLAWSSSNVDNCYIYPYYSEIDGTIPDDAEKVCGAGITSCDEMGGYNYKTVSPSTTTTYALGCLNGDGSGNGNENGRAWAYAKVTINNEEGLSCGVLPTENIVGETPEDILFTINANGGSGIYQYKLDTDDGNIIGSQSSNQFSYTYNSSGGYTPVATVTDSESNSVTCNGPWISLSSSSNCSISAHPSSILSGQSSMLSWGCSDPGVINSCEIDDEAVNSSGYVNVSPRDTTIYTLTCTKKDGTPDSVDDAKVSVGFLPVLREILPRW